MGFSRLAPDWQEWLLLNLSRECSRESVMADLAEKGGFPEDVCQQAVAEGWQRLARRAAAARAAEGEAVRPEPCATANSIDAGDRQVNVLLAVEAPRILLLQDVLCADECDGLIAAAEARMNRSTVVDDETGVTTLNTHRSSSGAFFQRGESDLVERIERRLACIARWPVERGEGIQVLRYEPGAEYRPHFDWFDPALPGPRRHLENGGQRVGTFVMYLADVEAGGGTSFPALGLDVRPKKGSAVFFADVDADGVPDRKTLHAGGVVVNGVKYIATKWMRERTYG